MSHLSNLSDDQLHAQTLQTAKREQELTIAVVEHLEEVARRRLHAKRGYSSIFEYCVKALGYSEGSASQRVGAMRLIQSVPEARERFVTGSLNLSSAAAIQKFIRKEKQERPVS